MSATPQEIMTARLFFNAAFPTMQVLLDDNYEIKKKFHNFSGVVQFGAKNDGELLCCNMTFDKGTITVAEGPAEKPDLTLTFPSVAKMIAILKGGLAMPAIKGKVSILPKFLSLLLGLMIMTKPNDKLRDDGERALKVKCSLYMITRALSQYNKLGDPTASTSSRSSTTGSRIISPAISVSKRAIPSRATACIRAARPSCCSTSSPWKGR